MNSGMSQRQNPRHRVNVYLPEGVLDAVDAICDEYSLARSRVIADLVERQVRGDDVEEAILDAIPEATLRLAEKERREREMLDKQKLREKKHSYEDRILGCYRKRIEGDAAYPLEGMRDLAKGYREDAHIWHDDPDEAERKAAKNDEWLAWYEAGYWARQHADEVETEVNSGDVNGWFEVGRDIYRLREHLDDVVAHVRQVADGDSGWDADAVIDSVASEWSVSRGAAHLVIESLTVEDASVQEALSIGGERLRATEDLALEAGGPDRGLPESDSEADADPEVEVIEAETPDGDTDDAHPDEHDRADDRDRDGVESSGDDDPGPEAAEPVRDGGLETDPELEHDPAELAREEVIETAVAMLEEGAEEHMIELEVRGAARSDTEATAAIAAARDRVDSPPHPDGGVVAATDGGATADD